VHDGDVVLADGDGVVVVPAQVEARVLELALARARSESQVLDALLSGAKLAEVWQRWGVL
jgi:regulator of RNase E activity RraA